VFLELVFEDKQKASFKSCNNKSVVFKYLSLNSDKACANSFFFSEHNCRVVNKCPKILVTAKISGNEHFHRLKTVGGGEGTAGFGAGLRGTGRLQRRSGASRGRGAAAGVGASRGSVRGCGAQRSRGGSLVCVAVRLQRLAGQFSQLF